MKRILLSALFVGAAGLFTAGCDEKEKAQTKTTVETPGGSTTKTTTVEEKKSGDHKDTAPAPAKP